ncbi:hypothetical protein [Pseudoflavitalea rhizosphaerae]|uniref:hypothetical protein n=1 Tax=Pseudoflavitalea rhizosphaerae TaxID=1884793 RepID=UPI000F8EC5DC|nr:hypothetical protein [Pseudoflavitalea rhizosphaerae]
MKNKEKGPDPLDLIHKYFNESHTGVYTGKELTKIFHFGKSKWNVHPHLNEKFMMDYLIESGILYKASARKAIFAKTGATNLTIGCQLYQEGILSHASALSLQNIIAERAGETYITIAKSRLPTAEDLQERKMELNQSAIDKAFAKAARSNHEVLQCNGGFIHFIHGRPITEKQVVLLHKNGERISATTVERALIDIVIRPGYIGGPKEVMKAFEGASESVTPDSLHQTLVDQRLIYPYEQAIGFYLQRAGFPDAVLKPWMPAKDALDFYLDYQIEDRRYDKTWKIFYPSSLGSH